MIIEDLYLHFSTALIHGSALLSVLVIVILYIRQNDLICHSKSHWKRLEVFGRLLTDLVDYQQL